MQYAASFPGKQVARSEAGKKEVLPPGAYLVPSGAACWDSKLSAGRTTKLSSQIHDAGIARWCSLVLHCIRI